MQTTDSPGLVFHFDAFQMQYLIMVAERRNCGKEPNGVPNRKFDESQSDFALNLHGVMGEYPVSKLLGIKLDASVSLSGDDKIADLYFNGIPIQVKTNMARGKTSYLYFNSAECFRAKVAVLALIQSPCSVRLAGWIPRDTFLNTYETRDFGYGARLCVASEKLLPIETLKNNLLTVRP